MVQSLYSLRRFAVSDGDPSMEYASGLVEYALGIWFAAWAFRKRYEVDYRLDRGMQILRWSVIGVGFAMAQIAGGTAAKWVRLCGAFIALAFLCWPNLAYHVTRLFRPEDSASGPTG